MHHISYLEQIISSYERFYIIWMRNTRKNALTRKHIAPPPLPHTYNLHDVMTTYWFLIRDKAHLRHIKLSVVL